MNEEVLKAFDLFLDSKGLEFEGVIIGGGALILMGVITRATRDIDFLSPPIPEPVKRAAEEFSIAQPKWNLGKDWFNNGPIALEKELPTNWTLRVISIFRGTNLKLSALAREDFLKTKLFAYCDRTQPDFDDLLRLKPSVEEIEQNLEWVSGRDQNPGWNDHVIKSFEILKKALGYEQ